MFRTGLPGFGSRGTRHVPATGGLRRGSAAGLVSRGSAAGLVSRGSAAGLVSCGSGGARPGPPSRSRGRLGENRRLVGLLEFFQFLRLRHLSGGRPAPSGLARTAGSGTAGSRLPRRTRQHPATPRRHDRLVPGPSRVFVFVVFVFVFVFVFVEIVLRPIPGAGQIRVAADGVTRTKIRVLGVESPTGHLGRRGRDPAPQRVLR
ncbi:hypothetical protein MB27_16285 [Actinoplanes utahensis]|uniref:Uncharacterized protein n=1 Tax=Actinoplanes utahensis TaxID=1869 RepID=A0A0A6X8V7_ACTUT|nr:hypothetical protein MB27_16285 [Actinoplanes utahensis]